MGKIGNFFKKVWGGVKNVAKGIGNFALGALGIDTSKQQAVANTAASGKGIAHDVSNFANQTGQKIGAAVSHAIPILGTLREVGGRIGNLIRGTRDVIQTAKTGNLGAAINQAGHLVSQGAAAIKDGKQAIQHGVNVGKQTIKDGKEAIDRAKQIGQKARGFVEHTRKEFL